MNALPFSLFKRGDRPYFLVKFKDEAGNYLSPLSTKAKSKDDAMQVAFRWLRDGIPQKKKAEKALRITDLSLKDTARKIKGGEEAETLLAELKRLGWVKSYVQSETPGAAEFIPFLSEFWDWEKSPYIKEKLRKRHGIHRRHCKQQGGAIALYWEPFFKGRYLGEITAADIGNFIDYMGDMELSPSRKNVVIKAGTKPLRWAYSKGLIDRDPTRGHTMFTLETRKREILTPAIATAVFNANWEDGRAKVANMLAAVTGMRNGEILALRAQDLGADCLNVQGSWSREDGRKLPKNNKTRTVEIPFPDLMNALAELGNQNPWSDAPDRFIFWSTNTKNVPMQGRHFVAGLRNALMQIGFSQEEAEKYEFHGWRHFFTSYMIRKLDKKLLKSQTGHLTDVMLAHYGDHETEGDKEQIQAMSKETFAGLLPERSKMTVFKRAVLKPRLAVKK
ncbi:MAG: site-specific integrase [Spirochaetes bacterium]|nr:site-specific integrase [Spirochaetota bacterium]